jgi:hypothetical protein
LQSAVDIEIVVLVVVLQEGGPKEVVGEVEEIASKFKDYILIINDYAKLIGV